MYEQQFNPYAANVAIVKDYFKSGKVLVTGILYIVSLIISIAALLIEPIESTIYQSLGALEKMGVDVSGEYLETVINSARISSILSVFVSSVVTILTAAAFIIIFAKSRSANPNSSPAAGVGILHVLAVISFVLSIIATVIVGIVYLIAVIAAISASSDSVTVAAMVVVGIVIAIALFFLVFISACTKNYYRSVKYSLTTVKLHSKGAVPYGVFCIIGAVLYGISTVSMVILTIGSGFTAGTLVSILAYVVTLFLLILNASIAIGYNSHIKRYVSGYGSSPYGDTSSPVYPAGATAQPPYAVPRQEDVNSYPGYDAPMQQNPYNDGFNDGYSEAEPPAPVQASPAYCPNCGAPCDDSAVFCSRCGGKLK